MTDLELVNPIVRVTVEALFNSLLPGLGLTALIWCLLRFVRKVNATTRYAVWYVALMAVVCLPVLVLASGVSRGEEPAPQQALPEIVDAQAPDFQAPSAQASGFQIPGVQESGAQVAVQPPLREVDSAGQVDVIGPPVDAGQASQPASTRDTERLPVWRFPESWAIYVMVVWLLIAAGLMARLFRSYYYVRRLNQRSSTLPPEHQHRLRRFLTAGHVRRKVQVRSSGEIAVPVPVAVGFVNPVILIPESLPERLTDTELDHVVLHELAHVRRWDDVSNVIQKLTQALFFFHPAVIWIGRRLDLDREVACDDWAISIGGTHSRVYASCLKKLAELTMGHRPLPDSGFVIATTKIEKRIRDLIDRRRNGALRISRARLAGTVGVLFVVGIMATQVQCVRATPDADEEPAAEAPVAPAQETPDTGTEAQAATPASSFTVVLQPTDFEGSLSGDTLAKYESLPQEFRDALDAEASENGLDSALASLRVLPEDAPPIASLLTEEVLAKFEELDEPRQRHVLLEGYPNASRKWDSPEPIEGDPRFSELGRAVEAAHFYLYSRGELGPLPPYDEALSAAATSKLESLHPLMQHSFRMWWETERHGPWNVNAAITKLETALLAAPAELPDVRELGLSAEALAVLEDLPRLEDFVRQYIAFNLVQRGDIEPHMRERLDNELRLFAADEGPEFLARGEMPGQPDKNIPPYPLICAWGPSSGIWPEWAIPEYFRDLEPTHLVLFRPDPEVVLSPEALRVLYFLDEPLRDRFNFSWYDSGISPSNAWHVACLVMQDDLNLRYIPFTSMPPVEELMSPESKKLFASMSEIRQDTVLRFLANNILKGKVQPPPEHGPVVNAYGSSPEEFLAALKLWGEDFIRSAYESFTNTVQSSQPTPESAIPQAPSPDTPVMNTETQATQREPGFLVPHPTDFEDYLTGETLATYRVLPIEFREALQAYVAWSVARDEVDVIVAQKIRQWPSAPAPMSDTLSSTGYQMFQDLFPKKFNQALFLLYFYPYVLATEQDVDAQQQALERYLENMQPKQDRQSSDYLHSEPGTQEFEEELDTMMANEESSVDMAPLPPIEETLVPEAIRKLGSLGLNLGQAFHDVWGYPPLDYSMVLPRWIMEKEVFLLKAPSGMELPPIEDMFSDESLRQFQSLSFDDKHSVQIQYARSAIWRAIGWATCNPVDTLPSDMWGEVCGPGESLETLKEMVSSDIDHLYADSSR